MSIETSLLHVFTFFYCCWNFLSKCLLRAPAHLPQLQQHETLRIMILWGCMAQKCCHLIHHGACWVLTSMQVWYQQCKPHRQHIVSFPSCMAIFFMFPEFWSESARLGRSFMNSLPAWFLLFMCIDTSKATRCRAAVTCGTWPSESGRRSWTKTCSASTFPTLTSSRSGGSLRLRTRTTSSANRQLERAASTWKRSISTVSVVSGFSQTSGVHNSSLFANHACFCFTVYQKLLSIFPFQKKHGHFFQVDPFPMHHRSIRTCLSSLNSHKLTQFSTAGLSHWASCSTFCHVVRADLHLWLDP